jgi:hypothetical protein
MRECVRFVVLATGARVMELPSSVIDSAQQPIEFGAPD